MSAFAIGDLLKAARESDAAVAAPGAIDVTAVPAPVHDAAPEPAPLLSPLALSVWVRIVELALVAALAATLHLIEMHRLVPADLVWIGAIACVSACLFHIAGAYRLGTLRRFQKGLGKLVAGWALAVPLVAVAMELAKIADQNSRLWLASAYLLGPAVLCASRFALSVFVRTNPRLCTLDRKTAIVGGGPAAEDMIRALEASHDSGIDIVGVFEDRNDSRSSDTVAGHPKLGSVGDLVDYARRARVDLIVFTLPISAEERILQMLAKLSVLPIDIRLSAHAAKLRLRPRAYSHLGQVPVLDVFDRPLGDWDVIVKSAFDRAVALVAILALSIPMLAVALAVRLTSRGPILFKQKRYGFNNELIDVFKFRSMYVDQGDAAAVKLVTKGDKRVTPVGRIIRKTSLDELPQLFNVLKGDLSLVGPRPHALQAKAANTLYDQVVDGYFARHKVKPGITGWAQINGWRGETDTAEKIQRRVEHDLHYIENWSILFDIKILAKTPFALLKTENAY